MNKLIKLSETHYIVVDDSEIKDGEAKNYFFHPKEGVVFINYIKNQSCLCNEKMIEFFKGSLQKITHSFGIELEGVINKPLSEVKEAIYGYSVEKMVEKFSKQGSWQCPVSYVTGFNAHKELVKDKLFTIEDIEKAFEAGQKYGEDNACNAEIELHNSKQEYIQSLLPKNEWDVTFNEQGKLKLI